MGNRNSSCKTGSMWGADEPTSQISFIQQNHEVNTQIKVGIHKII